MTRNELRQQIITELGACMIKIELSVEQLDLAINRARNKWIYWTSDNSTQEKYFLLLLKAGQRVYDMPVGVFDVVGYDDKMANMGLDVVGFNPLWYTGAESGNTSFFAIQNPFMTGLGSSGFDAYGGDGPIQNVYTPVDSYLMKKMIEMFERQRPDKYRWTYSSSKNQLELSGAPLCGEGTVTRTEGISGDCGEGGELVTYDSPGYVLIRSFMLENTSLPTYTPALSAIDEQGQHTMYPFLDMTHNESLFDHFWIQEYATAVAKGILGLIRRKLSNVSALGNTSLTLDGDQLISESREEILRLEEDLDSKYSEGFGISLC